MANIRKKEQPRTASAVVDLEKLKATCQAEFTERWENIQKSEENGLEGFKEIEVIGSGAFGEVKLIEDLETGSRFACKAMLKREIVEKKRVKEAYNEKRIMHSVSHPALVSLLFSRKDNDYIYLGMPYIEEGDMFAYHCKTGPFSEYHAKFLCAQIFLGLEYLNMVDVVYRDLKLDNILIDNSGYLKLTDFGFAKRLKDPTKTHSYCGTPEYMAPEIIQAHRHKTPYGKSADWWSFGVVLFELVSGSPPFERHTDENAKLDAIVNADYVMSLIFSAEMQDLVRRLLQPDPNKRIGLLPGGTGDIRKHPWFNTIDWISLANQKVPKPNGLPPVKGLPQTGRDRPIRRKPKLTRKAVRSKENQHAELFSDF